MRASIVALIVLAVWGARRNEARADVPREIAIAVELSDREGRALEGEHRVHLRLYADGLALHAASETVYLERGAALVLFEVPEGALDRGAIEIGLAIDGDPEMSPRIPIVSVPFALIADRAIEADRCARADRVEGLDPSAIQAPIRASCAEGESIRTIAPDGAIVCEPDDTGPSYTAGWGTQLVEHTISVDASAVQRRIAGSCPAGQAIRAIDVSGHVSCERIPAPRSEAPITARRSGSYGTSTVSLGSASARVCSLVAVGMRELDVGDDHGECAVRTSGGQWVLEAILGADPSSGRATDAYVTCRAQCLTWS